MPYESCPELSVVVPVYNEEGNVASFLTALARQQGVRLEVILSDGASSDRTLAIAQKLHDGLPFPLSLVQGTKGRGRQLNRGADAARAETLLFLHIDSSFEDPLALRKALDSLGEALRSGASVAGRFALRFGFPGTTPFPYRFYGAKAALDRPGCTHGDQGFLIRRDFFAQVGPYDTSLPLMEDTFLAERVRREGRWLLLPAAITTSPRRFQTEGLLPRQTLNAILMNLAHIGHLSLVRCLQTSYRSQDATARLQLKPFLEPLQQAMAELEAHERRRLWCRTGAYVRGNAWQIAFFLDVLTGGIKEEGRGGRFLDLYDRLLGRLIDNKGGDLGAALLTWLWFRLTLLAAP
ncbi:TIGR04283 family arsenosugar biosynthesis glycosyltransferase [Geomonas oryzisoli]|uniref:TIGR04283 family arsenosugar biosynthesis glycosyltransferase n=1 Tax=Geomonas oryzisoli TaxID=2847992 RepID=A0ABX8J7Z7_9BACT|nr:TIGR04283 family arsenosugar biosynthesis glycosyltransferase [Geomonas oryzisoli]QWV94146.1 TIGR04283 family arsenosugar biosynthesis glycosyltransferase [Geomonas oryzisoli]